MIYAVSDVVVSTSIVPETFGRTISEANAMNRIVVAFNHGGPSEIILDGQTGFLTPVADILTLAEKLDKVLDMKPQDKKKMEKLARERTEALFSIEKMCETTLNLYKEILK